MSQRQGRRRQQPPRAAGRTTGTTSDPQRTGAAERFRAVAHRHATSFLVALVAVHAVLSLLALDPTPHTGGDNAGYITLARSLLERGAYLELWDPAEPIHTKYPPVFPLVLAAAMAIGLAPWVALKLIVVAFSALGVAFTYLWIRSRGRPALAAGVGTVVALSPGILLQNHWVLSDVPFWGLTMLALWAVETAPRNRINARALLAVAAIVLAYFTRSAGLPLLLAAAIWLAWRRRWTLLGVLTAVTAPLAAWWMIRARSAGGIDYTGELWMRNPYDPAAGTIGVPDLFPRIGENLVAYVTTHLPFLLTARADTLGLIVSVAVTLLAVGGWAWRVAAWRRLRPAELVLPLYMGLILIWPAVWAGDRFLLPVYGVILFFAADALVQLVRRLRAPLAFSVGAAAVALIMLLQLPSAAVAVRLGRQCQDAYIAGARYPCLPQPWRNYFAQSERIPQLLPERAVVLSRKPRLTHVLADGRAYSITYPFTPDPEAFLAFADSVGARYLLFDELGALSQNYLVPVLTRRPDAFCIMDATGPTGTALFGIREDARGQTYEAPQRGPINFEVCDDSYRRPAE
jgi:hypothetical protein